MFLGIFAILCPRVTVCWMVSVASSWSKVHFYPLSSLAMLILQVVAFLFSEGYWSLKESHINLEEASQLIDKEVETVTRNQKNKK